MDQNLVTFFNATVINLKFIIILEIYLTKAKVILQLALTVLKMVEDSVVITLDLILSLRLICYTSFKDKGLVLGGVIIIVDKQFFVTSNVCQFSYRSQPSV